MLKIYKHITLFFKVILSHSAVINYKFGEEKLNEVI